MEDVDAPFEPHKVFPGLALLAGDSEERLGALASAFENIFARKRRVADATRDFNRRDVELRSVPEARADQRERLAHGIDLRPTRAADGDDDSVHLRTLVS